MKKKHAILLGVLLFIILVSAVFIYEKAYKNNEPSIDELMLLANQGDIDAQNKLGAAYFHGKGVEKNIAEARRWFIQSAQKGYAKAQYNIGVMYYVGQGVPQNQAEALIWFSKAAGQGLADAQYNLGVMNYQGVGIAQNYPEAFKLYSQAAQKNHALAQYNLGLMYLAGNSVPKDPVKAYMWLSLAAGQKVPEAVNNRDYLDTKMAPAQLENARKLASDWKPIK
jgi:TPR repeat protein